MIPAAFHLAILRSAAVLVPATQRADWFAEWASELWYVRREPHGRNVTAFCIGAFRDAFWLWRDYPFPNRTSIFGESPARCLSLLAALGALCVAVALLLPAARTVLLSALYPRNLAMLSPAALGDPDIANGFLDPFPSVSREQFESLKAQGENQFTGLAFYVPAHLAIETSHGKRNLSVVRTTADLFQLLNVPVERGSSGTPLLVLTTTAWHRYFNGDPRIRAVLPDHLWNLPGSVDGWLIEDQASQTALPTHTEGFVLGRLRYNTLRDNRFRFLRLQDRSLGMLAGLLMICMFACVFVAVTTSGLRGGHPRSIGPRRGLFLAAKTLLVLPILIFGSLDLGSLGNSVTPVFLDIALFGSVFAVRWILADQRQRCPVCLRLLANPVRIGESSRILLEWHGTELMCLRGHGLLYVPEWPAIWSHQQRWMKLGPSWAGLRYYG